MADEFTGTSAVGDILDTPELESPPAVPDAHEGEVVSVTSETYESGSTSINVTVRSRNAGFEDTLKLWPPSEFVENYAEVVADPTQLSAESPGTNPETGKARQSAQQRFASTIANKDKDAEVQRLRTIAFEELGADGIAQRLEGLAKPTSFSEFVSTLNTLLQGVPVIFTRATEKNAEGAFAKRLKVNRIYGTSILSSPKALKRYVKAWE